jgi:hypothetical protein
MNIDRRAKACGLTAGRRRLMIGSSLCQSAVGYEFDTVKAFNAKWHADDRAPYRSGARSGWIKVKTAEWKVANSYSKLLEKG